MYNPKSMNAEEFINHEEILDSLKYADENKNNLELIDSLLEKARPRKTEKGWHCQGLTHREASVLLACDNEEINRKIFKLAEVIKKPFTETELFFLPPSTFPTTASTVVFTARTILKTKTSQEKNLLRQKLQRKLQPFRIWVTKGLQ